MLDAVREEVKNLKRTRRLPLINTELYNDFMMITQKRGIEPYIMIAQILREWCYYGINVELLKEGTTLESVIEDMEYREERNREFLKSIGREEENEVRLFLTKQVIEKLQEASLKKSTPCVGHYIEKIIRDSLK